MGTVCSRCCFRSGQDAAFVDPGISLQPGTFVSVGTFQGTFQGSFQSQCCSFMSAMTGILDPEDLDRVDGLFSVQGAAVRDRVSKAIAAAYDQGVAGAKDAIATGARDPIAQWRDLSSPGVADCWVRTVRKPVATSTILCSVKSVNQTPNLALLNVDKAQSTVSGSLMLMTDMDTWPLWVPMCQSCTVLERYGPNEMLTRIEFKIPVVGIRTESIIYTNLVDRLDEEGYLDFRACTPLGAIAQKCDEEHCAECEERGEVANPSLVLGAADEDFDTFWGAQVPKAGRFTMRGEVDCGSMRLYPTGNGQQEYVLLQVAEEKSPMDSIVNQIWKTISRQLMGIIVSKVALQKPLEVSAERLEYFVDLERRIAAAVERASGAQGGD